MILFPIITIFFTAFIARIILGSWFSPGSFFSICWSFFLIVPLVFAASFNVDIIGLWFIVIFSMSCASGSIIASKVSNDDKNINLKTNELFAYNLMPSYLLLCLISFLGLYFLFSYALITYNFGYNSFNWLSIPNLIAIDRYNDELNYPFIIKYSLYCIYPANLLSGILIGLKKIKSIQFKIVILLPLIAAFILGVLEGARSSILLGLILFFSSWLSTSLINFSQNKKKKSYLKVAIGLIFSFGTFTSIFIFVPISSINSTMV